MASFGLEDQDSFPGRNISHFQMGSGINSAFIKREFFSRGRKVTGAVS
jgi:hypothetical protein